MNLHAVVSGAVGAINPNVTGTVKASAGYTTLPTGRQMPAYAAPYDALMQVQPLSASDIKFLDALSIMSTERSVYLNGVIQGINRAELKGGDVLTILGKTWYVTSVIEPWNTAGWCKVGVTQQVPT